MYRSKKDSKGQTDTFEMKQDSSPGWKYAGLPPKQYRALETALVRH